MTKKLKTGNKVKWDMKRYRNESPSTHYGEVVGWYAEDFPIILQEIADDDGNTAFVCYCDAIEIYD